MACASGRGWRRALAAAIGGQRPQRKVGAVAVILQVEDAGEAGRGIAGMLPEAVGLLRATQILDATRDRRLLVAAHRQQRDQRPGTLVGSALEAPTGQRRILVTVIALAPAAV